MAKDKKKTPGSDACNQWYCNIRQGSFCCKECADKDIYNTPCLNDPDKCGYYKDGQKEKFIELIQAAVDGCARHWAEKIADHLIANGATIQQWIDAEKDPQKNFVSQRR